jgi:hypothetical protein
VDPILKAAIKVAIERRDGNVPKVHLGSIAGSGAPGEGHRAARSMPPDRFECRGEPDNRSAVRVRRIVGERAAVVSQPGAW